MLQSGMLWCRINKKFFE